MLPNVVFCTVQGEHSIASIYSSYTVRHKLAAVMQQKYSIAFYTLILQYIQFNISDLH